MNIDKSSSKSVIHEIVIDIKYWWSYFLSKRKVIVLAIIIGMTGGVLFSIFKKPIYAAEITFVSEADDSKLGSYAGIASQFGISVGPSGSNIFEGDNITSLFKSRSLVRQTLLNETNISNKKQLLIDYYIQYVDQSNKLSEIIKTNKIVFSNSQTNNRLRDSIVEIVITKITKSSLSVEREEKKLNIVSAKMFSEDETFARFFIEQLTNNAISYYVKYKTRKALQNVDILQNEADSVKAMLSESIHDVASLNDLNVNPAKQIAKASSQRRGVDLQVNGALYTEILKNLELAKITLRKETPFIQIIDTPVAPLEKKRVGKLLGALVGGFLALIIMVVILWIRKIFR
jgi:uncharacterized protein involved in exopolysaccharide biosynthesis